MHFLLNRRFRGPSAFGSDTQTKRHVFKHRHVTKQCVVLKHKAHLSLTYMDMGGVFAAESDSALASGFQARNDAQQRGFATA